jgi:hypothetical protein
MDNIRRQYAKNAIGLQKLHAKAVQSGKKVNGYTAEQLRVLVADYEHLSVSSDAELAAHLGQRRHGLTLPIILKAGHAV